MLICAAIEAIPPLTEPRFFGNIMNILRNNILLNVTALAIFLFAASASAAPRNQLTATQIEMMHQALQSMEKSSTAGSFVKMGSNNAQSGFKKVAFQPKKKSFGKSFRVTVTATAYTSHVGQTDSTPNIAAWGDRLKPGMKVIAVSRDLLKVYGLKHKQKVRIKGLKGEYLVLDKMNKRWRKKIDIYMGMNKRKAFKWGRRKVEIQWN